VPGATTALVVAEGLGSFSTPYQSAQATEATTTGPQTFQRQAGPIGAYYRRRYPPGAIVFAADTSAYAAPLIMVSGREILPIGGFSGNAPSPTLAGLRSLVAQGRLRDVLVPIRPPSTDPRLTWVRRACRPGPLEPYADGEVLEYFTCRPASARTPARGQG